MTRRSYEETSSRTCILPQVRESESVGVVCCRDEVCYHFTMYSPKAFACTTTFTPIATPTTFTELLLKLAAEQNARRLSTTFGRELLSPVYLRRGTSIPDGCTLCQAQRHVQRRDEQTRTKAPCLTQIDISPVCCGTCRPVFLVCLAGDDSRMLKLSETRIHVQESTKDRRRGRCASCSTTRLSIRLQ